MDEQLYYRNGNWSFRTDEDGNIFDAISNQKIGVSISKSTEILQDIKSFRDENLQMKEKLSRYEKMLIDAGIIQPEPTVESLQNEMTEIKQALKQMTTLLQQQGSVNNGNNSRPNSNSTSFRGKSEGAERSNPEIAVNGNQSKW